MRSKGLFISTLTALAMALSPSPSQAENAAETTTTSSERLLPSSPSNTFTIAAWVNLGLYWGSALIAGPIVMGIADDQAAFDSGWRMMLPLVGPLWAHYGGEHPDNTDAAALSFGLSVLQTVAFGLVLYDLILRARVRRAARAPSERPSVTVVPTGSGIGVSAVF